MKLYFRILIILLLGNKLNGQSVAPILQTNCATATQGTVGNIVISYTIGEMVLVDSYKNTGLFVTQGIAQPEVPNGIVNYSSFTGGDIIVFPNPTPNQLSIQISITRPGKMKLQVYDVIGKLVLTDAFDVDAFMTQRYKLDKYADGTFLLRLQFMSNDGIMNKKGTYKIIKAS